MATGAACHLRRESLFTMLWNQVIAPALAPHALWSHGHPHTAWCTPAALAGRDARRGDVGRRGFGRLRDGGGVASPPCLLTVPARQLCPAFDLRRCHHLTQTTSGGARGGQPESAPSTTSAPTLPSEPSSRPASTAAQPPTSLSSAPPAAGQLPTRRPAPTPAHAPSPPPPAAGSTYDAWCTLYPSSAPTSTATDAWSAARGAQRVERSAWSAAHGAQRVERSAWSVERSAWSAARGAQRVHYCTVRPLLWWWCPIDPPRSYVYST